MPRHDTAALIWLIAGLAGVALFILAAILAVTLWYAELAAGAIAIVAGVISLRRTQGGRRNAQALMGLVLRAIIVALLLVFIVLPTTGVVDW